MRIDSCRKCGGAMMPHEKCDTCGNNISLICNLCGLESEKQIHPHPPMS